MTKGSRRVVVRHPCGMWQITALSLTPGDDPQRIAVCSLDGRDIVEAVRSRASLGAVFYHAKDSTSHEPKNLTS